MPKIRPTIQPPPPDPAIAGPDPRRDLPTLRPVLVEDIDRLWDLLRTDPRARDAFGLLRSSVTLHRAIELIAAYEASGRALIRAIDLGIYHVGIAAAFPILPDDGIAIIHLYLCPSVRGAGSRRLVRLVLQLAHEALPGLSLVAVIDRPGLARWLGTLGFSTQYVVTKPPPPIAPPDTPPEPSSQPSEDPSATPMEHSHGPRATRQNHRHRTSPRRRPVRSRRR